MRELEHRTLRTLPLLVVGACLLWPSPASAGECGDPCTVTGTVPDLHLVDTSSNTNSDDWEIRTEDGLLRMGRLAGNQQLFTLEIDAPTNTLHVDSSGRIGINTTVPVATLQVNSTLPEIRLDDTSSGGGLVDLLMLGNNFSVQGNGSTFSIMHIDTRAPFTAFLIDENGRVGISSNAPQASLHVGGDARVDGDVALGSSRALKTAFEPVSSSDILAKVAHLPVASWRYKSEDETARHIGPFAEDFQRLFGLGDGETISTVDAQGVAFAAIQGLQRELVEKDAEWVQKLAEKDAEIGELKTRLSAVEERLNQSPTRPPTATNNGGSGHGIDLEIIEDDERLGARTPRSRTSESSGRSGEAE
jgi:hypothetical protein